jgi:hypothetical protein
MLKARDLWGLVDGEDVKPVECEVVTIATYTKRGSRAFNLIVQSMYDS